MVGFKGKPKRKPKEKDGRGDASLWCHFGLPLSFTLAVWNPPSPLECSVVGLWVSVGFLWFHGVPPLCSGSSIGYGFISRIQSAFDKYPLLWWSVTGNQKEHRYIQLGGSSKKTHAGIEFFRSCSKKGKERRCLPLA